MTDQQPVSFRRPEYETIQVDNPERVIRVMGTVLRVPAQRFEYYLVCGICGAEWGGKWNPETGLPTYSGGVVPARRWHRLLKRRDRTVVACRCTAGRTRGLRPATDHEWLVTLRRKRWIDRLTARTFVDTYRDGLESRACNRPNRTPGGKT